MSVSGVSSATNSYLKQIQSQWRQQMQDLKALGSALKSGNLTRAQTAFAAWGQDLQANTAASTDTTQQNAPFGANSQANSDFAALSTALQSGDISGAKQAFASLQKDLQTAGHVHGHHHHHAAKPVDADGDDDNSSATTQPSTDSSGTQSLLDTQA
jgi:iron uptake system EfeUOB component EfeO/EfeM